MEIESKNNLARLCILISKLKESNSFKCQMGVETDRME